MAMERVPFEDRVDALVNLLSCVQEQVELMIQELLARRPDGGPGPVAASTIRWKRQRQRMLQTLIDNAVSQVHGELPPLFDEAWTTGLRVAGVRKFGEGLNVRALDVLAQGLRDDVDAALYEVGRRTNDVFRQLTMKQVALHIVAGTGAKTSAKNLEAALVKEGISAFVDKAGRRWSLSTYTDMAIRTVSREAMTIGTVQGLELHGQELCKYSHHAGSCDICLPYDGQTFALPGHSVPGYRTLETRELPPVHPRCVASGTEVATVGTPWAGSRFAYDGPVIYLRSAYGHEMTIGSYHPVLTGRGWLPAQTLRQGDQVIRGDFSDGAGRSIPFGEPDLHYMPTAVEQIFDTLRASGLVCRTAATSADFHGDGRFVDGYVDVVYADGLLSGEVNAAQVEELSQLQLILAARLASSFDGDGLLELFSNRNHPTSRSRVRCTREGSVAGHLAHNDVASVQLLEHCDRANVNVCSNALGRLTSLVAGNRGIAVPHGGVSDTFDVGSGTLAVSCARSDLHASLLEPLAQDARADAVTQRNLTDGLACCIALDELVEVRYIERWHGYMYDLSAIGGMYFADSLLVHNCKHVVSAGSAKFDELERSLLAWDAGRKAKAA